MSAIWCVPVYTIMHRKELSYFLMETKWHFVTCVFCLYIPMYFCVSPWWDIFKYCCDHQLSFFFFYLILLFPRWREKWPVLLLKASLIIIMKVLPIINGAKLDCFPLQMGWGWSNLEILVFLRRIEREVKWYICHFSRGLAWSAWRSSGRWSTGSRRSTLCRPDRSSPSSRRIF